MKNAQFFLVFLLSLPILVFSQSYQKPVPTAYQLQIVVPDLATSDFFNGSVEVNLTLLSTSPYLLLDAEDLEVDESSVSVMRESQTRGWVPEPRYSGVITQGSLLNFTFSQPAIPSNYRLRLNYTGRLRDAPHGGFIRVSYRFHGQTKYMAMTSLERRHASAVFPCMDDLSPRTIFQLDVTVDKSLAVLSSVKHAYVHNVTNSTKMFHFSGFPEMPVSQLGWAVVDLATYSQFTNPAPTSATTGSAVVHVRAPHGYRNHSAWAGEHAALLVSALDNYTLQRYPLDKLELLVVPELPGPSLDAYGFIAYPEESVLFSPGQSSTRDSHRVLLEVSRGAASQWLQGLTSMRDWQHQWFPRALKQYFKYTVAAMLPVVEGWELQDHLVVEVVQRALAMDVNFTLTPATTSADAQSVVQHVYQPTAEYKGAAILRMLQHILGNEVFDTSISAYFKKTTNEPKDFWDDLYTSMIDLDIGVDLASRSVNNIMDSWLASPGHPLVNVTANDTHFHITQPADSQVLVPVTYMVHGSLADVKSTWLLPGGAVTVPREVRSSWLLPGESVTLPRPTPSSWILVNVNQTGFYRVNYDASLWALLSHQLSTDHTIVPRLSRAQLIDDVFWLTQSSILPVDILLTFSQYLTHETDYFPWHTALRNFQDMQDRVYDKAAYQLLQTHLLRLLDSVVVKVGMVPRAQDSHTERLRQAMVLESACALGHSVCIQKAVSILKSWMASTYYDPDLNMALLCAGVRNSPASVWYELWSAFNVSVYPTVRANILTALACTNDYTVLSGFLTNITSASTPVLSSKDKTIFLETLASSPYGAEAILDWLIETLMSQAVPLPTPTPTSAPAVPSEAPLTPAAANTTLNTSATVAPDGSELNFTLVTEDAVTPTVRARREAGAEDKLREDQIVSILSYALPKLTTLQQGTKLERLVQQSNLSMSNDTLTYLKEAVINIYKKDMKSQMYNAKMTVWLSNAAECSTPGTTTPGTTSPPPRRPATGKPSAAPASRPGLITWLSTVVVLAVCSVVRW